MLWQRSRRSRRERGHFKWIMTSPIAPDHHRRVRSNPFNPFVGFKGV